MQVAMVVPLYLLLIGLAVIAAVVLLVGWAVWHSFRTPEEF
jgi:hypothetical protein